MRAIVRFTSAVAICLAVLSAQGASAATATDFVSPARADALASPLTFRTIQTTTEANYSVVSVSPDATGFQTRVGIDSYIGGRIKIIDVPVVFAFSPDLQTQLNIPLVSAGSAMVTGLGDIRLSLKYRVDMADFFETYYILTAKFPSGNSEQELGTGSYDYSFTHKSIFTYCNYRTTLMAGITIPTPGGVTVLGSKVEYGPTVSYMVATERALYGKDLQFGIKAAGLHAFNSRVNSEYQQNGVTTLDLVPEVTWRFLEGGWLTAGIIVPIVTVYDLPGAANKRDPIFNLGVYKTF